MDEMSVDEDTRNQKSPITQFQWKGKKIRYYEDAAEAVKGIEDGKFDEAFHQLFPTPDMFNSYNLFTDVENNEELLEELMTKYFYTDLRGCLIFTALLKQLHSTGNMSTSTSTVHFHSIEMLITKGTSHRPSTELSLLVLDQDVLRDGFTKNYIDPHESVMKIAQGLTENMSEFCAKPVQYIAPYTSLVTSSMMGKTRLMKELGNYLPVVYLCFREQQGESGYPPATPYLLSWFREGACKTLDATPESSDINADRHYIIPTLKHSLFLLYLLKELNDTTVQLLLPLAKTTKLSTYLTLLGSDREDFRDNFQWMWKFFADHDQTIVDARNRFFARVLNSAKTKFQKLRTESDSSRPDTSDGITSEIAKELKSKRPRSEELTSVQKKWASNYLTINYPEELRKIYQKLLKSLLEFCPKLPPPITSDELTLIICFDEARHLCTSSGSLEYVRKDTRTDYGDSIEKQSEDIPFSNFRAMRRALRFLRQADPIPPRVFGLFTDTTSRLHNFQPRSTEDGSLRLINLPDPGTDQFKPICLFTSIDAHSQMTPQNYAVSDPKEVAKVERLLKFGRAGWYSLYTGESLRQKYYTKKMLKKIAIAKLLGISVAPEQNLATELRYIGAGEMTPRMRLRLLAVLAPRLALTAGPFTSEAVQMVSSHLAVLLRTDKERHFLQTFYPSEPILAEASAAITKLIGWAPLVRALYDQIQNGIVSAGFRGELLTKVLLLMAMDDTLKPDLGDAESPYWEHTQPIKVKDFLDNWLAPPNSYRSFCHALSETTDLKLFSEDELKRFMNGHVFFTHFVRLDCAVSLRSIACAWNQGAALMAKEGTESFDHIIPVMLAGGMGGTNTPTFGRLHHEWDQQELERACSNISFILINSKMYAKAKNQDSAADKCIPTKKNFENFKMVNNAKVMFLSIAQDFGPHRIRREALVNIKGRGTKNSGTYRQIRIVLKGLGPDTYQCLRDNRSASNTPNTTHTPVGSYFARMDEDVAAGITRMQIDEGESEVDEEEIEDDEEDPEDDDSDDEVSGNGDRSKATQYLRMLRHQKLDYLPDNILPSERPQTIDFLSLTYSGQAVEIRQERQGGWDKARARAGIAL
jgi:hypothetical protein